MLGLKRHGPVHGPVHKTMSRLFIITHGFIVRIIVSLGICIYERDMLVFDCLTVRI